MHVPTSVLVTGGCGFIGSNVLNYLFDAWPNTAFVNYDKLILNSDACHVHRRVRNSTRYHLLTADIRNRTIMQRVIQQHNIDTIVHLAADCTSTRCYEDPTESVENNVIAFIDMLEVVKQHSSIKRFIHVSTDEVYGDSKLTAEEKGKTEDSLLLPGNPYAATKAACECYVHMYRHECNLPIIMLRINNIYGPNQWDVKVVPRFIEVAKSRAKFTIQGTGEQLRSWLYVDDAAEGIRAVTENGVIGETYNLGTDFEMNAHKVQSEVDRQLHREAVSVQFISIPDRPYNDMRYLIDFNKAYDVWWQ